MATPGHSNVARQPFVILDPEVDQVRAAPPAVVMVNPKNVVNVASMIRNCAAFGVDWLLFTGERIDIPTGKKRDRMPREERMRQYRTVKLARADYPMVLFKGSTVPIGIELTASSTPLPLLEHPKDAVYILGPEDGSIPPGIRALCHQIVQIPTRHCLNVATAGGIVLYDRAISRWRAGHGALPELEEDRGWNRRQ